MSNEMVPGNGNGDSQVQLPSFVGAQYATQEAFDELIRSSFLPRLSLCSGSSSLVTEGKMSVGKFALIRNKDDFTDYGDAVNVIPLSWRFVALRFGIGDTKTVSYYDHQSPEFKQVQADSKESDSRCSYGPQFLIWIPAAKDYATYLFGSVSARPLSRDMLKFLQPPRPVTMRARLVSNNKNKWHVPVIVPCTSPVESPDVETTARIAEKFNNPGKSEETVDFDPTNLEAQAQAEAAAAEGGRVR